MKLFKNPFHKKHLSSDGGRKGAAPLSIQGIPPAPLTPEPDEAELAAQALLEMMSEKSRKDRHKDHHKDKAAAAPLPSEGRGRGGVEQQPRDAAYYRALADRIRQAREASRLRTVRFLAFCEQELRKPDLPIQGKGSLTLLEAELYKRLDIVEYYGGDLKRRWQHCLADVTVRLMASTSSADNPATLS